MSFCESNQATLTEMQELLQRLGFEALEIIGNYIPAGIIAIGINEKIIYANDHARKIFGFNPCGLSLKEYALNMAKVRNLEDSPFLYEQLPLIKALLFKKTTHNHEIVIQNANKSILTLSANATPLTDKKGNTIGALAVFIDITDRRKAERAIKESEDKFRSITESSTIDISVSRPNGAILFVNTSYAKTFGYSKEELIGSHSPDLYVNPDDRKKLTKVLREQGSIKNYEVQVKRKDGTPFWVTASIEHIKFGGEEAFIGTSIDISERKKAEEALKDKTKKLEQTQKKLENAACKIEEYANRMEQLASERLEQLKTSERMAAIGATAGMVGHDIRNPLQAMSSDLYLIREEAKSISEAEPRKSIMESVDSIEANIAYINKIVSDLQDITRPIKPSLTDVNLKFLVNTVVTTCNVPGRIQTYIAIAQDLTIRTDADYLRRILTNLTVNAVQAMPNEGSLIIRTRQARGSTVITVEDTGEGIPESVKEKLFTPLFTTKSKGQGLGLAVVKRLVEGLAGTISFESQQGKGTKFIITLPLKTE